MQQIRGERYRRQGLKSVVQCKQQVHRAGEMPLVDESETPHDLNMPSTAQPNHFNHELVRRESITLETERSNYSELTRSEMILERHS